MLKPETMFSQRLGIIGGLDFRYHGQLLVCVLHTFDAQKKNVFTHVRLTVLRQFRHIPNVEELEDLPQFQPLVGAFNCFVRPCARCFVCPTHVLTFPPAAVPNTPSRRRCQTPPGQRRCKFF